MLVKSHRKTNAGLEPNEQSALRTLTAPYGRMAYASEKTGIIADTIRNIIQRGHGKREYVELLRAFIVAESNVNGSLQPGNGQ